jgi:hypothetical protein
MMPPMACSRAKPRPRKPAWLIDLGVELDWLPRLSSGWPGDERVVRFARATTAAVQMGTYLGAEVSWLHGEPVDTWAAELRGWPKELARKQKLTVEATMTGWATQFSYPLDLGDEARRLATALTGMPPGRLTGGRRPHKHRDEPLPLRLVKPASTRRQAPCDAERVDVLVLVERP